eukprot:CAMPEP_0115213306 /NCGR_PEP_ID=MMETSP0270-20121206/23726_1 /TAXON_ID=71861 /ORGANISM="Scrippsiella trochoidea, Strain CCMP3099" /LENGTH=478 /DNA_ID=CAMNT_0002627051 /DNA_START=57 /DNA_END=1493 /DNA_ORIENTATION=+
MVCSGRHCRCLRVRATTLLVSLVNVVQCTLGACPPRVAPPPAPQYATDLNGVAWPDYCFEPREQEEHFFIIGDWGGIFQGPGLEPLTAPSSSRPAMEGIDDKAQLLVAEQMNKRASISQPRYVLNVGDCFYWGGVNLRCGESAGSVHPSTTAQWQAVFEDVYSSPDLAGRPWLGVLGNHDYGGYMFTQGWDQAIAYTWGPSSRWVMPAQYWSTTVHYSDFSVDYLFVDSNMNDAMDPSAAPNHNLCSQSNNPPNATCGVTGPTSTYDCVGWFYRLWEEQIPWMDSRLSASEADWRVIVTHFPPDFRREVWAQLAERYGVDLLVAGHKHQQELSGRDPSVGNAAWVISGGGGGMMSEGAPREDGDDDMYGFMDVTISRSEMKIEQISHSGILRRTVVVPTRRPPTTATTTSTDSIPINTTSSSTTSGEEDFFHHDAEDEEDEWQNEDELLELNGAQRCSLLSCNVLKGLIALVSYMVRQ